MMYNHNWYKIKSQPMIDSLLRQYNYDSIISNFLLRGFLLLIRKDLMFSIYF
jgi:hypothetical protein